MGFKPEMQGKMRIIYIHGFNSGKGQKVKDLEQQGFEVYCPQLTAHVHEDIAILVKLVNDLKDEDLHIVGRSLGGYYALILLARIFSENAIHYHLINPSLVPWKSIKRFLNKKMKNYKSGEEYQLTISFLNALKQYVPQIESIPTNRFFNVTFYFGTKDEILDHSITKDWIQTCRVPCDIIETNQGHRYEDISTVIREINALEMANNMKW